MEITKSYEQYGSFMTELDLFAIAKEHYIATFLIAIGVGVLQGAMLARGVRSRFPSLRAHAKAASIILLLIFSAHAIFSIIGFATIETIDIGDIKSVQSLGDVASFAASVLGVNGGFLSVVAVFISLLLTLLFRLAELPRIVRYFVLFVSIITLLAASAVRFAGYTLTEFHITIYALYHVSLTLGVYIVMRRTPKADECLD